jgi:hypothetical protein
MIAIWKQAVGILLGAHYIILQSVNRDIIRRHFNVCIAKFTYGNIFRVSLYAM